MKTILLAVLSTAMAFACLSAYAGNDKADITTQGAPSGTPLFDIPDGIVTGADINRFVNAWVGGCD